MPQQKTLFVCHTLENLRDLPPPTSTEATSAFFATDSYPVFEMLRRIYPSNEISYLTQNVTVFDVMDSVQELRLKINACLQNAIKSEPPYLFEFSRVTEGGYTTQKILETLIHAESLLRLHEKHSLSNVTIFSDAMQLGAEEVYLAVAKSLGIKARVIRKGLAFWTATTDALGFPRHLWGRDRLFILPHRVIFRLYKLRFFNRFFKARTKAHKNNSRSNGKLVSFLLGDASQKHVFNATVVMQEISKFEDFDPVALAWQAPEAVDSIRKQGLKAEPLEAYLSLKEIFSCYARYKKSRCQILKFIQSIPRQTSPFIYKNVDLSRPLTLAIRHFIENDLLRNFFLDAIFHNYFEFRQPLGIKNWGQGALDLGRICLENLNRSSHISRDHTVIFDYFVGTFAKIRYGTPPPRVLDLLFLFGRTDDEFFNSVFPDARTVVTGFSRDALVEKYADMSRSTAEDVTGLKPFDGFRILFASSNIIPGYITECESAELTTALVSFAKDRPDVSLVIKPHPGESQHIIEGVIRNSGHPQNVSLIDKAQLPYPAIRASDILITKLSSTGHEAMRLGIPVISAVFDGDKRFDSIFEDGVIRCRTSGELLSVLKDALSSRERYDSWANERRSFQERFMERRLHKPKVPVPTLIASEIVQTILQKLAPHKIQKP